MSEMLSQAEFNQAAASSDPSVGGALARYHIAISALCATPPEFAHVSAGPAVIRSAEAVRQALSPSV